MEEKKQSKVSVPVAIVVAGALIAGAVYLSNTRSAAPITQTTGTTQQAAVLSTDSDISIRPISTQDHILGNPNAPVTMVVFTDLECPFCKTFHNTMHQVADKYGADGKVAWVYRNFPIVQLHSKAPKEAEASECAAAQGGQEAYWNFVNKVFTITPSNDGLDPAELPKIAKDIGLDTKQFQTCWDSGQFTTKVQTDYDEAINAGGRGTPYILYVSRKQISSDTKALIQNLSAQMPADTFAISKDNTKIAMSGALPFSIVDQILTSLLK